MDTPKCIAAGHDIPIFTAKAYQGRNRRLQLIPNAGIFIAPACTDGPVPGLQLRLEKSDPGIGMRLINKSGKAGSILLMPDAGGLFLRRRRSG